MYMQQERERNALLNDELGKIARARGITAAELAQATGYSEGTIERRLAGEPYKTNLVMYLRLCTALGLQPGEFIQRFMRTA